MGETMPLSWNTGEHHRLVHAIFVRVVVVITMHYSKDKNAILLLADVRGLSLLEKQISIPSLPPPVFVRSIVAEVWLAHE